jgi:DNA (cytosine-5)-methyltransferase 1
MAVVDVFCGIGGLSHGFFKEGFKVVAGIDVDPSCRYAFETNNKALFIEKSVEDIKGKEVSTLFGDNRTKILVGCAPCQPFSTYNRKKHKNDEWRLLRNFSRLVSKTSPDIVSMENVPQLQNHKVFKEFVDDLESADYRVFPQVVYCPDYGIPQQRKRLVLLASKFGDIKLIKRTHKPGNYKTVKDAIGKLRSIEAGGVDPKDPLHRSRNLTPLNIERIKSTPEGGGWESWDRSIRLKCHKRKSGESFNSVYGRMSWDKQASTITTESHNLGSGRFGHPQQNRAISIREAALLQTFPKYYRFVENGSEITFDKLSRHIGNAVPVKLGRVIAKSIKKHLQEHAEVR